jgi:four helix bundle protein
MVEQTKPSVIVTDIEAPTARDFVAKLSVSRKEARETRYWLRLAIASGNAADREIRWEIKEVGELRAMIIAAIKTAQASIRQSKKPSALSPRP